MIDEKGALKAAEAAALEAIADGKNHWEVAHAVVEAYEATRSAEPVAWEGRIDMAWADGARAAMNALNQYLPDEAPVREMELRIVRRQADAIAARKLAHPKEAPNV